MGASRRQIERVTFERDDAAGPASPSSPSFLGRFGHAGKNLRQPLMGFALPTVPGELNGLPVELPTHLVALGLAGGERGTGRAELAPQ